MKRFLGGVLFGLQLLAGLPLPAEEEFKGPITEPLPYEEVEFPGWTHDLRRFEVIFFGAVPLTYILTNLVYDFSIYASHNFDSQYRMGTQRDQEDIQFMLITSLSLSAGIGVLDFVIGQMKENRAAKAPAEDAESRGDS